MRRNVLLLQGPVGPFFARFSDELRERGFNVFKINFNAGDKLFYRRPQSIDYTGKLRHWESWIERLIVNKDIGRIYVFGDCRSYHRIAREVAERLGVRVFVFEEGYIRPNFVTLEENGVNGHSNMLDRPPKIDIKNTEAFPEISQPKHIFLITALFAILYYVVSSIRRRKFPLYQHHRPFGSGPEGLRWIRSGLRKWRYKRRERHTMQELLPQFDNNYFVCPLQVHCDMQVVVHSPYNSIEHYIGDVLMSFAKHAPSNKAIVFKHHPLDRGYTDYTTLFANLTAELALQGRVFYVHDVCLPSLLKHAEGTVLINSTVGMSSLFHGTPVKTLGRAVYDISGLTCQQELDVFWKGPAPVDMELYQAFRSYLIQRNQLNGNLYRRLEKQGPAGLAWSDLLSATHTFDESRVEVVSAPRLKLVAGRDARKGFSHHDDDAAAA